MGTMGTMTTTTMTELLARPYEYRTLRNPDGRYTAEIDEFPGYIAEGSSRGEGLQALRRVAETWMEAAIASGVPIPEPSK